MAEFKGTPGPWAARRVEPSRDWIGTSYIIEPAVFKDAPGGIAATIGGLEGEDANARLIAAAPEWMQLATCYRNTHNQRGSDGPCDCADCREFDRLMEKTNANA